MTAICNPRENYCVFFSEVNYMKDIVDEHESQPDVTHSVPDAAEEAMELLNNLGVDVEDITLLEENFDLQNVPGLTPKQASTLKKRIETYKQTCRVRNKPHRPDVRDIFNPAADHDPGSSGHTCPDGGMVSRVKTNVYPPGDEIPPDYPMTDEVEEIIEPELAGVAYSVNRILPRGDELKHKQKASTVTVDELGKKDVKILNVLANIELTAIFDEYNIVYGRRKTKPKVKESGFFGVPLNVLLEKDRKRNASLQVPLLFQQLIQHLENEGLLQEEGLLRISGRQTRIKELRAEWDSLYSRGKQVPLDQVTIHECTGLLKLFLRELPAPLLTLEKVDAFIQVNNIPDVQKQLSALNLLILLLPEVNRSVLKMLLSFLRKVVDCTVNKMNAENVAMVMAPNLFLSTANVAANSSKQEVIDSELFLAAATSKLTSLLITHYEELWMVPPALFAQLHQQQAAAHASSPFWKLMSSKEKKSADLKRSLAYITVETDKL